MTVRSLEPVIVGCGLVAVASSVTALLWAGLGQSPALAALAGSLVAVLGAVSVSWIAPGKRLGVRADAGRAEGADLGARVATLGERLDALEARLDSLDRSMVERTRATILAVSAELDAVGSVVRELAEAVAVHDSELFAEARPREDHGPAVAAHAFDAPAARPAVPAEPAGEERARPAKGQETQSSALEEPVVEEPALVQRVPNDEIRALLPMAIAQDRLELHLQSIVALPQRKVKLYEAMHYLRADHNRLFSPAELRQEAESVFAEGPLDSHLIRRAQRIIRHLRERNREVALLCRVSSRSFFIPDIFAEIARIAKTGRDDAGHLVFSLDQAAVRAMGPLEIENIEALQRMGYRLALDGVRDLGVDPRALAERGFRFVKAPADLLLQDEAGAARATIHPADLSGLLARHGMTLIADGIGGEKTVLDLLDFNVTLAQGPLFAPPRAVRIDLLDAEKAGKPLGQAPLATPAEARQEDPRNSFRSILRRANDVRRG